MDELVFGEKRYVSSKKAAKLTGYAKDYVGQLCREGKVEARLVGRNWYVLEDSIMEHRFGPQISSVEEEKEPENEENPSKTDFAVKDEAISYAWPQPTYTPEPAMALNIPVSEKSSESTSDEEIKKAVENPSLPISEMQKAWQEWFAKREEIKATEEALLPDASDMLLEAPEEEKNVVKYSDIGTEAPHVKEPEDAVPLTITRVKTDLPEPIKRVEPRGEPMQKSFAGAPVYPQRNVHRTAYTPVYQPIERDFEGKKAYKRPKNRLSVVKVAIFSLLSLLMVGTYLAISSIPNVENGSGNPITNYLNGVSNVEK